MSFRDWFRGKTPLQLALDRGFAPGGDLRSEVYALGDYKVTAGRDAEVICAALRDLLSAQPSGQEKRGSALHTLTGLFQNVPDAECDAFSLLQDEGTELLARLAERAMQSPESSDDVLFALKILAMYGTANGTDLIIRAARQPIAPGDYMWSVILANFSPRHPQTERIFGELNEPLPDAFIAVSLLDAANKCFLADWHGAHPFDCNAGVSRIATWLADPEHSSYAVSGTAAIPFIHHPSRERLLALANQHPDADVRLEAAWAAAKLGQSTGLGTLSRMCCDVNLSSRAKQFLKDLGHEDRIPPESRELDFEAKAEFAQWLAHPNELGRYPDELGIIDHRILRWPPAREPKPFWLIKYVAQDTTGLKGDDVGVGLVGSMTFCLFSYALEQRPPEDCYAIYCYWELSGAGLVTDIEVDEGSSEYDGMLKQWVGQPLVSARMLAVCELNPELNQPQRIVGLAAARIGESEGYAVLDGPRSTWYPTDEIPDDTLPKLMLEVHVGRQLLGFDGKPDRKQFLHKLRKPSPDSIVRTYEGVLSLLASGSAEELNELLGSSGLVTQHFEQYVGARSEVTGEARDQVTIEVYERILLTVTRSALTRRHDLLDSSGALGMAFESYVEALARSGRQADIRPLIALVAPYWQHNSGYISLGSASFKAQDYASAETFFVKLREEYKDCHRGEAMSILADIWHRRGAITAAKTLLLGCLQTLLKESQTATGSDRKRFEKWFQHHRATFLRLFPDEAANLSEHSIPTTTLGGNESD